MSVKRCRVSKRSPSAACSRQRCRIEHFQGGEIHSGEGHQRTGGLTSGIPKGKREKVGGEGDKENYMYFYQIVFIISVSASFKVKVVLLESCSKLSSHEKIYSENV